MRSVQRKSGTTSMSSARKPPGRLRLERPWGALPFGRPGRSSTSWSAAELQSGDASDGLCGTRGRACLGEVEGRRKEPLLHRKVARRVLRLGLFQCPSELADIVDHRPGGPEGVIGIALPCEVMRV